MPVDVDGRYDVRGRNAVRRQLVQKTLRVRLSQHCRTFVGQQVHAVVREIPVRAGAVAPPEVVGVVERDHLKAGRHRRRSEGRYPDHDLRVRVGLGAGVWIHRRYQVLIAHGLQDVRVRVHARAVGAAGYFRDWQERWVPCAPAVDTEGLSVPLGRQDPLKGDRPIVVAAIETFGRRGEVVQRNEYGAVVVACAQQQNYPNSCREPFPHDSSPSRLPHAYLRPASGRIRRRVSRASRRSPHRLHCTTGTKTKCRVD